VGNIYVQLSGGLGNQLFQYAVGRSISLDKNIKLVIDIKSGFFVIANINVNMN